MSDFNNLEEYSVIKAEIIPHNPTSRERERKVWIKYSNGGSQCFAKLFRLRNLCITEHENTQPVFKEIVAFQQNGPVREFGFAISTQPKIDLAQIKSKKEKVYVEQSYFNNHVPEKLFLPKNFPHKAN